MVFENVKVSPTLTVSRPDLGMSFSEQFDDRDLREIDRLVFVRSYVTGYRDMVGVSISKLRTHHHTSNGQ